MDELNKAGRQDGTADALRREIARILRSADAAELRKVLLFIGPLTARPESR